MDCLLKRDKNLTIDKFIQELRQFTLRQLQECNKIYNINPETL